MRCFTQEKNVFKFRNGIKKSEFLFLEEFDVLTDRPGAQHEILPKSYSSSGNRKNLPTQFLWQGRYFTLNFKNIDRFLPAAKGRQREFMCFKENWDAGRQQQCLCVCLPKCSCSMNHILKSYIRFGLWVKGGFYFPPGKNWIWWKKEIYYYSGFDRNNNWKAGSPRTRSLFIQVQYIVFIKG